MRFVLFPLQARTRRSRQRGPVTPTSQRAISEVDCRRAAFAGTAM
jgi:hypothetical protein